MKNIQDLFNSLNTHDDNFDGWKFTQKMYAKIEGVLHNETMTEETADLLADLRDFMEALQPFESKPIEDDTSNKGIVEGFGLC